MLHKVLLVFLLALPALGYTADAAHFSASARPCMLLVHSYAHFTDRPIDPPEHGFPLPSHPDAEKLEKEVEEPEADLPLQIPPVPSFHFVLVPKHLLSCLPQPGWSNSLYRPPIV